MRWRTDCLRCGAFGVAPQALNAHFPGTLVVSEKLHVSCRLKRNYLLLLVKIGKQG